MAGELNNGLLQSLNQTAAEISNSLKDQNGSSGEQAASLEGIHEITNPLNIIQSHSESIANDVGEKGWFHDILTELILWSDDQKQTDKEAKDLQDAMLEELSKMTMFDEKADKNTLFEKKRKPKVNKGDPKIDDLKDLPYEIGTLGSVLVNTLNKKDDKNNTGKSIQGFFKGLLEGVSGIAALGAALIIFAGATLLFNFVDWGKAIIGLLSFTAFTIGIVALAKVVGKSSGDFLRFAAGSLLMSAALGVFGVSLWIAGTLLTPGEHRIGSFVFEGVGWDNILRALGAFGIYTLGLLVVARLVGSSAQSFIQFGVGALAMSAALGVFAISLWIAGTLFGPGIDLPGLGHVAVGWDNALRALGFFGIFIAGLTAVAILLNGKSGDLINFAKSSMLMSASLVVFTGALIIVSNIYDGFTIGGITVPGINEFNALKALGFFGLFIGGFTAIAALANNFAPDITKFVATSFLMTASLVAFSAALIVVSNIYDGFTLPQALGGGQVPGVNEGNVLKALGFFGIFIGGFTAIAALASGLTGPIAQFTAVSLLMSASLIAFSGALSIANLVVQGGTADLGPLGRFTVPTVTIEDSLKAIGYMGTFITAFAAMGAVFLIPFAGQAMLAGIAMASGIILAISLATISFAKAMALAGIVTTGGEAEFEGKRYSLPAYNEVATTAMFNLMTKFIDNFADVADRIGVKGAIAVNVLGKAVTPLINSMEKMVNVVVTAAEKKDEIMSIVSGDNNALDHLMDPVLYMLLGVNLDGKGGMMQVANEMDKKGAQILAIVAKSIVPLVDAMDKMIDVVDKAAKMTADPYPDMKAMVAAATTNLNMIMIGPNGNDGFLNMFVNVANATNGTSKSAVQAIQAMPPLTETLSGLLDVVQKAAQIPFEAVQAGIRGLSAVTQFLSTLMNTVKDLIPGGVGGAITKFFGGDPLKKLDQVHELLQPGGAYYELISDLVGIAGKFSGNGFDNLAKISLVGTFTIEILEGSENFKNIMKNISSGVESFKNPSKLESVANAMVKFGEADLSNLDKFAVFAAKYKDIEMAANAMEKLANSMNKINSKSMVDQLSGSIDKVKNFFGFDKSTAQQTGENAAQNNAQTITITPGMELEGIAAILSKWDANGVKVYGIETATPQQAIKVLNV